LFNAYSAIFQLFHGVNKLIFNEIIISNHIGGVMVSVLAASAVNRGFETRSGKTKDYEICICGFSTKPAALRR
jgi:membrane associated rhomboid family serine protease